jgi:hypothetical protein
MAAAAPKAPPVEEEDEFEEFTEEVITPLYQFAAQLLALIAPCRTATLRVPGTRTPPANICTHEGARGRHGLGRPVH